MRAMLKSQAITSRPDNNLYPQVTHGRQIGSRPPQTVGYALRLITILSLVYLFTLVQAISNTEAFTPKHSALLDKSVSHHAIYQSYVHDHSMSIKQVRSSQLAPEPMLESNMRQDARFADGQAQRKNPEINRTVVEEIKDNRLEPIVRPDNHDTSLYT